MNVLPVNSMDATRYAIIRSEATVAIVTMDISSIQMITLHVKVKMSNLLLYSIKGW